MALLGYEYGFNINQHPTGLIIPPWVIIPTYKKRDVSSENKELVENTATLPILSFFF